MRVQLHRSWPRALLWRWNQTAVIVLLALAGMILPRFALLADMPRRWPHMLGVALGLGWWLCCQPSAAGWLLIAGSLLAALRSAVKPSWR